MSTSISTSTSTTPTSSQLSTLSPSSSTSNRIPIHIAHSKAYVWSATDAHALRTKHHICGVLTGTLPGISQQNVFLGLPLMLLPEEVVLLVENGVATLIDDLRTLPLPLPSSTIDSRQTAFLADIRKQQRTWQREEAERQTQSRQIVLTDAQREKREQRMKEKEEKRKRAEEAARLEAEEEGSALDPTAASSSSLTAPSTATPPVPTSSAPSPLSSQGATAASGGEIAFGHPPSSIPYALSIPSTHSSDHYSTPCSITHTTLSSARSANLWSFPSNLDERARAGVFRALWERGYFMGGGIKFGGELMIYPGDPLRYHSHFVSTALLGMDEVIRPMQLVAWGRLGTATKKAHLLCGWSDEEKEVEFFSLEWASF